MGEDVLEVGGHLLHHLVRGEQDHVGEATEAWKKFATRLSTEKPPSTLQITTKRFLFEDIRCWTWIRMCRISLPVLHVSPFQPDEETVLHTYADEDEEAGPVENYNKYLQMRICIVTCLVGSGLSFPRVNLASQAMFLATINIMVPSDSMYFPIITTGRHFVCDLQASDTRAGYVEARVLLSFSSLVEKKDELPDTILFMEEYTFLCSAMQDSGIGHNFAVSDSLHLPHVRHVDTPQDQLGEVPVQPAQLGEVPVQPTQLGEVPAQPSQLGEVPAQSLSVCHLFHPTPLSPH